MERLFWNKLRILVTNKCNYKCPFCHNEGQEKDGLTDMMSFESFKTFIDIVNGQDISELHVSGGEPFLNKEIVRMIEYVDNNTSWGIGCATNLSLLSNEQIKALAKTRVKFNIQFPFANEDLFKKSTGNGRFEHILNQIKLVKDAGIRIGLNAVVQSDNIQHIRDLILFAINNELPLKLLPQLGLNGSDKFKEYIYPILNEYAASCVDKKTGAHRWIVESKKKETNILYIDSPCFNKNIQECRTFGELRIHPDMSLQPCIQKESVCKLDMSEGQKSVLSTMTSLWSNFKIC